MAWPRTCRRGTGRRSGGAGDGRTHVRGAVGGREQLGPPLRIGVGADLLAGLGVDHADLPDALGEGVLAGDRYAGAVDGDDGELAVGLKRLALVDPDLDHRAERIKR